MYHLHLTMQVHTFSDTFMYIHIIHSQTLIFIHHLSLPPPPHTNSHIHESGLGKTGLS